MNPAYIVLAACSSVLTVVIAIALQAGQLLTRRVCIVGLLLHGSIVAAIVYGAYAGTLPRWFTGRGIAHYDTFMHFYLVGLLTFFIDGVLRLQPFRFTGINWSRVGLACLAISLIDEIVIQPRCPNRGVDLYDALGNGCGAIIMSALALRARRNCRQLV